MLIYYFSNVLTYSCPFVFFFTVTATPETYTYSHTLSLHDALPISAHQGGLGPGAVLCWRSLGRWAGGVFAIDHPDVVDRGREGRDGGAGGEHPALEEFDRRRVGAHVGDLEEGRRFRRLLRRLLVTGAGDDLQRAEAHRLVERRLEGGDPGGDLVEALQHGDVAGDGRRRSRRQQAHTEEKGKHGDRRPQTSSPSRRSAARSARRRGSPASRPGRSALLGAAPRRSP